MLPPRPLAAACFACLALSAAAAVSRAQGTPIFTQDQTIFPSDGADWDHFGHIGPSAIHDDLMIIGAARFDGPAGTDSGAAYIFRLTDGEWIEEAKPYPPDGVVEGYFGANVAIYDDFATVSSVRDGDPDNQWGAVYAYRFNGTTWEFEQKFLPGDFGSVYFGKSLAAHEDVIFIGDFGDSTNPEQSGAVSVYRYIDGNWVFEQKVMGADIWASQQQGWSIATDGERLIMGTNDNQKGRDQESWISIDRYNGIEWITEAELTDYGLPQSAWYGRSVAIRGYTAVVGCPELGYLNYRGRAYVYTCSGPPNYHWTEQAILEPAELKDGDYFGEQVAMPDESTIVVQAMLHGLDGYGYSTLFVFRRSGDEWVLSTRLTTTDADDNFGFIGSATLAAEGIHIASGSFGDFDPNGTRTGSIHYFSLSCPEDLSGDGFIDQPDLGILLASYAVDDGGDIDGDGDTDQADLGLLLAAYETFCK
jgi:FG-GAP repeat